MKPIVDINLCEGNGFCVSLMPAVFELPDDEDYALVVQHDVPETERAALQLEVRQCPRQAISIKE